MSLNLRNLKIHKNNSKIYYVYSSDDIFASLFTDKNMYIFSQTQSKVISGETQSTGCVVVVVVCRRLWAYCPVADQWLKRENIHSLSNSMTKTFVSIHFLSVIQRYFNDNYLWICFSVKTSEAVISDHQRSGQ